MNTGQTDWCAGETRNVTVTVQNSGALAWADVSGNDFNVGIKWNAEPDYIVRVDAQNLAPGATTTYTFSLTAPLTSGSNNLSFDIVREGCFWFANNSTACGSTAGPGNVVYTSVAQNIKAIPTADSAGSDITICNGSSVSLNGRATAPTVITTFNGSGITINDSGNSSPYPSTINVSGLSLEIINLRLVINNLSHTWPSDIDIVLFGPSGAHSIIFTDAIGGSGGVSGRNYTFEIGASALPITGFPASGTYGVINGGSYDGTGTPSAATSADLNNFIGTNPNGVWSLYVYDDIGGDSGSIGSWALEISASGATSYSWSPTTTLSNPNISNPTATPSSTTTYTMTATANGCGVSDDVTVTVVNQPSVGTMTISQSAICEGETVTISNSASNGTIAYSASSEGGYPCNWDIISEGYTGSSSFDYSFTANPNTSACEADPYRIHVYSAAYNATCGWSWTYGSGSSQYINVYPAPSWGSISPSAGNDICLLDGVSLDADVNNADPSASITWRRKLNSGAVWTNGLANNGLDYPAANEYDYQPIYSTTITGCDLSSPAPITVQVFDNEGWTGTVSSDWHNASNWCGGIPNSGTAVRITPLASNQPIISSGTANVCDITIDLGAQLSLAGNQDLNVYCDFTNHGTFISGNVNETLVFRGNPSNLFSGNDNINNLNIAAGASLEINDDLNILGDGLMMEL
jgi:subtilisin-like proprotein convertase family protein